MPAPKSKCGGHFLRGERAIVKRRLSDLTAQEGTAPAMMPHPKQNPRAARLKHRRLRPRLVGRPVGNPVTKKRDDTVRLIGRHHVHQAAGRCGLHGSLQIPRPGESATPRGPFSRLSLAKHNRVERGAILGLEGDGGAAALLQVGQGDPRLQGLLDDVPRKRS